MEPNYEEIHFKITDEDVRNASYWSVFATPPSGITYGANGIWPWIREGELILNHRGGKASTWEKSIDFPGSIQIGYMSKFMQQFEWWKLTPAQELLMAQPGEETYNHYISMLRSESYDQILAYMPVAGTIKIRNPLNLSYQGRWFNPVTNENQTAKIEVKKGYVEANSIAENDRVLILTNNK